MSLSAHPSALSRDKRQIKVKIDKDTLKADREALNVNGSVKWATGGR